MKTADIVRVKLIVNGTPRVVDVESRRLLSDLIRHELGLHGTHVGCEQGACGACTVLVDGVAVRSCLMFAPQADGTEVRTVESLADGGGGLNGLQQAFTANHALQCGFCTPGFLMTLTQHFEEGGGAEDVREVLSGNLCRCTGYENIVRAVQDHARREGR